MRLPSRFARIFHTILPGVTRVGELRKDFYGRTYRVQEDGSIRRSL